MRGCICVCASTRVCVCFTGCQRVCDYVRDVERIIVCVSVIFLSICFHSVGTHSISFTRLVIVAKLDQSLTACPFKPREQKIPDNYYISKTLQVSNMIYRKPCVY